MITFWVSVLALSILLYVLLDGFDLGVGILFGFTRNDDKRRAMINAVAPFWDGNETWMVGALVAGLPLSHGNYAGGEFGWLSIFSILSGVGLCLGYALLGACWLVRKCEGEVQAEAYRLIPALSLIALAVLAAVFIFALREHLQVLERWIERPYLFLFPLLGIAAGIGLMLSVCRPRELAPCCLAAATFAAPFCPFAISFWPYMIPFSITVDAAAAPHASLAFMFWREGLFVLPLMLGYTAIRCKA